MGLRGRQLRGDKHRQLQKQMQEDLPCENCFPLVYGFVCGEDVQSTEQDARVAYELTIRTGTARGSGLSEPMSGVWVCLIGEDSRGSLHMIMPLSSEGVTRFQQSSEDTISLVCPDLGHPIGMLIGPQFGRWRLDEVLVEHTATGAAVRFICGRELGHLDASAAWLKPSHPDNIVYGSGSTSKQLTKEEARLLWQSGMEDYAVMKTQMLVSTFGVVAVGTLIEAIVWGPAFALLFGLGGIGSLGYQFLLQEHVDAIVPTTNDERAVFKKFLASPVSRIVILGLSALTAHSLGRYLEAGQETTLDAIPFTRVAMVLNFAAGLLSFKIAVVASVFTSRSPEDPLEDDSTNS